MEIRADRRRRVIRPDAERVREVRSVAESYRSVKLRLSKLLAAIERGGDHLTLGHASVRDFAAHELGIPGRDVPLLLELGRSLALALPDVSDRAMAGDQGSPAEGPNGCDAPGSGTIGGPDGAADSQRDACVGNVPSVEERVLGERLSMENAAELGRLLRTPGVVAPRDHARWVQLAESLSAWKFARMVRKALEEAGRPERTVCMPLQVTESARDDFRRARDMASRRAGRVLSEGETFALVVRRYLQTEDGQHVGSKARRVGPTAELPGRRYVPAAVKRAIRARSGGCCEVPGCSNTAFLELMHVGRSHAAGGAREERDLAEGCTTHHLLLDAGVIRFAGWDESGHPRFRRADGRLLVRAPRPTPALAGTGPPT